ncbi:MAG: hypothetical protein Q9182_005056 [Xanthomendoza sp. 2 TL-2023]
MVFPFPLPTTSPLPHTSHLTSPSHPSLPLATQTHHSILRSTLKAFAHAPRPQKPSHIPSILSSLHTYLPHLFALSHALSGKPVRGEDLDIILKREIETEWTSVLAANGIMNKFSTTVGARRRAGFQKPGAPGGKKGRVRLRGLDAEIVMVLSTLAGVETLLAREQLRGIFAGGKAFPEPEERGKNVGAAMRGLLAAHGIHVFILSELVGEDGVEGEGGVPEMDSAVQNALAELAMAEATLLAVLKDDPYPAVVGQARDKMDREWMVRAPEIPKVRAHLFARLCIAAGEHAAKAEALFVSSLSSMNEMGREGLRVDEDVVEYVRDLRRTARAKACRFFGIDEELGGETGKAIAWLRGAKRELGISVGREEGERSWAMGLGKLKKGLEEKREDKRIEKGGEWGADAGRMEETRVVEMLEKKWVKVNDTVSYDSLRPHINARYLLIRWKINTQLIPPFEPLLAGMPSGREIHSSTPYVPPELDADVLEKMRAPPDADDARALMNDDDSSEDEEPAEGGLPGGFPSRPAGGAASNEYY